MIHVRIDDGSRIARDLTQGLKCSRSQDCRRGRLERLDDQTKNLSHPRTNTLSRDLSKLAEASEDVLSDRRRRLSVVRGAKEHIQQFVSVVYNETRRGLDEETEKLGCLFLLSAG